MTQPAPHGYPDWGRFVASSDKLLLNDTQAAHNNTYTSATIFVGDIPYIGVRLFIGTNSAHAEVRYYLESSLTTLLATDSFDYRGGSDLHIGLLVKGPFVSVVVTPTVNPIDITLSITSRHGPGSSLTENPLRYVLISQLAVAIGAGATVQAFSTEITPGPAMWSIQTNVATWTASIGAIDAAGVNTRLDLASNVFPAMPRLVFLPPTTVRIGITNTSGAAGTVDFFCTAQHIHSPGR
jgi:hypothetical protein